MAKIVKEWIEDGAVDGDKFKLTNNQTLKSRNQADDADVDLLKLDTSDELVILIQPKFGADPVVDNDLVRKLYVNNQDALRIALTEKAAANGVATLDANSKIPTSQMPALAITDVFSVADIAARDALTIGPADGEVQEGDVAVVVDASADPLIPTGKASYIYGGAAWILLNMDNQVISVAGKNGVVTLDTDDITEATNLYFTDARAKAAAVSDAAYDEAGWDGEVDTAPSKNAVRDEIVSLQSQIDNAAGSLQGREVITLVAQDITNGYIDLAQEALTDSIQVHPVGGIIQEPTTDFTETLEVGVTRITFAGDLLELTAGQKLIIYYEY